MTMEKRPFEDVSLIKNGDIPLPCWFSGKMSEKLGTLEIQLVKWISIHHFHSDLGVFSCEKHQEPTKIHRNLKH